MKDWKTTLTAFVTGAAYILAGVGFDLSKEVQDGIVVVGLFLIGLFAGDSKEEK
jgi:hypothetical protein